MKTISLLIGIALGLSLGARTLRNPVYTDTCVPKWMAGANMFGGFGFSNGLTFGYVDQVTGDPIFVDPGASFGAGVNIYRQVKSCWLIGAQVGYSNANALSGEYTNITSNTKRGVMAEVNGGVLLLSKIRHRVLFTVGPVMYTRPVIYINITDPNGPGNVVFNYKPAFGFAVNASYILVLKKIPGQLTFGINMHNINYSLDNFEVGGAKYAPGELNPERSNFKNPVASGIGVVVFGYQYTW